MTIQGYADAVGVTAASIYNAIKAGRLSITLRMGAKRSIYDIDIQKHPIASYKKGSPGRPKSAKNKRKTKIE